MINLDKPLEAVDYKIEPIPQLDNQYAWQIKLLAGPFKDKSLVVTNIEYSGKTHKLRFMLDVYSDNIIEPATPEVEDLAFEILQDIIRKGIADGSVVIYDKD